MNKRLADLFDIFKGPAGIAIAAIGIAVAYYTYETLVNASGNTASGAPPQRLSGDTESISAIPTGLNSLTSNLSVVGASSPSDAPVGIWGLIGSVTNDLLGGAPQDFGTWAGEHIGVSDNRSLSFQGWSGNPFGAGTNNTYADAVNNSPPQATTQATPYVADYAAA